MTQERLSDLLRAAERKVTIDEINRKVADHYTLRMADLLAARRVRRWRGRGRWRCTWPRP